MAFFLSASFLRIKPAFRIAIQGGTPDLHRLGNGRVIQGKAPIALLWLFFPAEFSEAREGMCGPHNVEFCHVAET